MVGGVEWLYPPFDTPAAANLISETCGAFRFPLHLGPRGPPSNRSCTLTTYDKLNVAAARLTSLPSSDLFRPRDWTNRYMEENLMTALPADTFSDFTNLKLL